MNGSQCKFAHDDKGNFKSQGVYSASNVCKFFTSPSGCMNGDACPFAHVGQPSTQYEIISTRHLTGPVSFLLMLIAANVVVLLD